jgi:hypothetical protein
MFATLDAPVRQNLSVPQSMKFNTLLACYIDERVPCPRARACASELNNMVSQFVDDNYYATTPTNRTYYAAVEQVAAMLQNWFTERNLSSQAVFQADHDLTDPPAIDVTRYADPYTYDLELKSGTLWRHGYAGNTPAIVSELDAIRVLRERETDASQDTRMAVLRFLMLDLPEDREQLQRELNRAYRHELRCQIAVLLAQTRVDMRIATEMFAVTMDPIYRIQFFVDRYSEWTYAQTLASLAALAE